MVVRRSSRYIDEKPTNRNKNNPLLKISGAVLPICIEGNPLLYPHSIHVGYTQRAADLGLPAPEPVGERVLLQYNERTDGDLFAYGNDHISADGTANAVTMLLEKLG